VYVGPHVDTADYRLEVVSTTNVIPWPRH